MAGIDALTPPATLDPNARMWAQIRSLQLRMAPMESRRNLVYRASKTNYVPTGTDSVTFDCAGRSLLVQFGSNRLLLPAASSGGAPRLARAYLDLFVPIPARIETIATSFDTNPNGAFQTTNVSTVIVRDVPPGQYTAEVSQAGATELRYHLLIWSFPLSLRSASPPPDR